MLFINFTNMESDAQRIGIRGGSTVEDLLVDDFDLDTNSIKIEVNGESVELDYELQSGDNVCTTNKKIANG